MTDTNLHVCCWSSHVATVSVECATNAAQYKTFNTCVIFSWVEEMTIPGPDAGKLGELARQEREERAARGQQRRWQPPPARRN